MDEDIRCSRTSLNQIRQLDILANEPSEPCLTLVLDSADLFDHTGRELRSEVAQRLETGGSGHENPTVKRVLGAAPTSDGRSDTSSVTKHPDAFHPLDLAAGLMDNPVEHQGGDMPF